MREYFQGYAFLIGKYGRDFLPGVDGQLWVHGEVHGHGGGDPDVAQRWPGSRWHPGQGGFPQVIYDIHRSFQNTLYVSVQV